MVKILVVGQTPPPYGGQAVMIQKMLEGDYGEKVRLFHVKMTFSREMDEMGKFKVRKLFELCKVIIKTLIVRFIYKTHILYYPPSGPSRFPVMRDMAILITTRWLFRKTIFHFHASGIGEYYHQLPQTMRFLFRLAYFYPEVAIRLSELAPDDGKLLKARQEYILPNGIEDAWSDHIVKKARGSTGNGVVNILFVGLLCESKGVMILLQACAILRDKGLTFHVHFIGKFESQRFERKVQIFSSHNCLDNFITFLGVVAGERKWKAFASAQVFCLPTYAEFETFPIVLLEAMQFALPVVATRWRGLQSVVEEGVCGFLVPIKDHNAVADKLELLIRNPDLRNRMGEQGRKRYLEHFTIEKYRKNLKKVFEAMNY